MLSEENIRIIFGLKLKQLRSEKKLSLQELAQSSGLSISYINEIEKGKKYPKTDKIVALSEALNVPYDKLVSLKLTKTLAPLATFFSSKLFQELPLEMFGIDPNKLVEIIANAPAKVNAFISTLIEIARNYDLTHEEFYLAALRSYQESQENYFPEIEKAANNFSSQFKLNRNRIITSKQLQKILENEYNYEIDDTTLNQYDDLKHLRSLLIPGKKNKFLINKSMTDSQRTFLFGRELGYNYLNLTQRAYVSYMLKAESFEQVLNNFKASYFSSALIVSEKHLINEVKKFVNSKTWNGEKFLEIMYKYTTSPELFMHRLTNILPKYFGLSSLFFLRFEGKHDTDLYTLTKELHLSQLHNPHGNQLNEHYCRRWVSLQVLKDMELKRTKENFTGHIVGAQTSKYENSDNEYFIISIARPKVRTPNVNCSVSIGFSLNKELKKAVQFWDDPKVPYKIVNETCERCPITDCNERKAAPVIINKELQNEKIEETIETIIKRAKEGHNLELAF